MIGPRQWIQHRRHSKRRFLAFGMLLIVVTLWLGVWPAFGATRQVVLLYDERTTLPGLAALDTSIFAALTSKSSEPVEVYREMMDLSRFGSKGYSLVLEDYLRKKYADKKIDVVVAVMGPSLDFLLSHESVFPGTPIVFCGIDRRELGSRALPSRVTGVFLKRQFAPTLDVALKLHPGTSAVVFVGGASDFDSRLIQQAKDELRSYESRLHFVYLTGLPMRDLLARVSKLPPHTIVLYSTIFKDGAGAAFVPHEAVERLSAASNAPVYGFLDQYLGHGIIGGRMYSMNAHGEVAANVVLKVLAGAAPSSVPVAEDEASVMEFDGRQLQRWGIRESHLPPGGTVLYRQLSFWDQYRFYAAGAAAIVVLQTLIIGALLLQLKYRRRAEASLRESEGRFRLVANSAPVLIWTSGTDRHCDYFNRPWLEFTGRTLEEELGDGWTKGVHPEDLGFCLAIYNRAFDKRVSFKMEYRLRRHDGEYCWVVDRGVPRFDADGAFAGYIGSCVDVTERKLAEDALRSLSGQLIAAQEEERRRIAREVHDDYQQRLAMACNSLVLVAGQIPNQPETAAQSLHDLHAQITELTTDLHSLSHRLHSSALETLGLVAGVSGFCKEFQAHTGLKIDFLRENVPERIPANIALCLFRVVQESLRNVKRHSGADHAEVQLHWENGTLSLSISDAGNGFDPTIRSPLAGIGVRSMEERLRLVGGSFEIHSGPSKGTVVTARVPFDAVPHEASQPAAGR